jgi:hypothetical protein
MTRKDYELIAKAVNLYFNYLEKMMNNGLNNHLEQDNKLRLQGAGSVILRIANALEIENPRFNRARFLSACGVKAGK